MEPIDSLRNSTAPGITGGGNDATNGFYLRGIINRATDDERMQLIINELNLVGQEIDNKKTQVRLKANFYHVINTLSSLLILICAAVSLGIEAAADCRSIPVIVLASIIFVVEGTHKLCRWGPLGTLYKTANIQLNRISRQCREYMYFFERYTPEQLFSLVMTLRSHCDDVDSELFNLSMAGTGRYGTNFEVDPSATAQQQDTTRSTASMQNRTTTSSPEIHNSGGIMGTPNSQIHIHINSPSKNETIHRPTDTKKDEPLVVHRSPNSVRVIIDSDSEEIVPTMVPVQIPSVNIPLGQLPTIPMSPNQIPTSPSLRSPDQTPAGQGPKEK